MDPSSTDRFDIEGFHGEVSVDAELTDAAVAAITASNPVNATETIHWGRNYLYSVALVGRGGPIAAVVKLFRNQGWRRRMERRLKGSKAQRSWSMALAMRAAGVRTPEPLILLESVDAEGPSIFVTRRLEGCVEARYLFRALKGSTLAEEFPWAAPEALATEIAQAARQLHDAGFWHRDFSIGNLLITPRDEGGFDLDLVDLNRARSRRRVSVSQRTRDLCRLGFHAPEVDRIFVDRYWQGRRSALGLKWVLYRIYRAAYLGRVEGKKRLRSLFGGVGRKLVQRKAYAHIPLPPDDADMRDKSVWDVLSDQPHQHASRSERWHVRLLDSGSHARAAAVAAAAAPAARRRYRELCRELWTKPRPWPGVGIGISAEQDRSRISEHETIVAIDDLGVEQVLLRFHPWDENWDQGVRLAAVLSERSIDLVFALPQVRALVHDPERWRAVVGDLGRRLLPYGNRFQIGHAINRSKWGLWNYREYVELMNTAASALRALGEVEVLGPGVIDFEPHAMASALNYPGVDRVDVATSLLYVDRRGAPENEQLGFDALGKAAVFRAIGETSRSGASRYWVTEFNWPLWEGPHSPAGRAVSVDEERQANYLVRYCVPLLSSGLAERAYWWQLEARGYGLIEPRTDAVEAVEGPRRRPAFHALATMQRQLGGTGAHGPLDLGTPVRAYRFSAPERGELLVAWSLAGDVEAVLPRPVDRVVTRDGSARAGGSARVSLSGAPAYFWLDH